MISTMLGRSNFSAETGGPIINWESKHNANKGFKCGNMESTFAELFVTRDDAMHHGTICLNELPAW